MKLLKLLWAAAKDVVLKIALLGSRCNIDSEDGVADFADCLGRDSVVKRPL
jgi:hypothetical protein